MAAVSRDLKCKKGSCRYSQGRGNSTYKGPEQPRACVAGITQSHSGQNEGERMAVIRNEI